MYNSWVDDKFFSNGINMSAPRKVKGEFGCALLLYAAVFVQLIISFCIFGFKNSEVSMSGWETRCPGGYVPANMCGEHEGTDYALDPWSRCITEELCQELKVCVQSRRRLSEQEQLTRSALNRRLEPEESLDWWALHGEHVPASVWEFLEEHVYHPITLFLCAAVLSVVWLFFLQKAAWSAIWGTIVADIAMLLFVFCWCKLDFDFWNWSCVLIALLMAIGACVVRRQINDTAVIMKQAMTGLRANARIFAVSAGVQLIWVFYFALWIASIISMHFVLEVEPVESQENGSRLHHEKEHGQFCKLRMHSSLASPWVAIYFVLCYYWVTYFTRNINLMLITANISGWYFNQEGSKDFWRKALPWSIGAQGGGNAMASAIMGASEYLMSRIDSSWSICFSLLFPWNWIFVCLALVFKTVLQTYTKFGLIAMTFCGRSFCESASKGLALLSSRLGRIVLTDYLGSRIMAWASYLIALGTGFAAWAWADNVQGISAFGEMDSTSLISVVIVFAYLMCYPFVTLAIVMLVESHLGWTFGDGRIRAHANSVMASLFLGSITMFILDTVSKLVVNAMDVVFFCFAVESDNRAQQERFAELYSSIKSTIVEGCVQGQSVVQGNAVGPQPARPVAQAEPSVVIVGNPVPSNALR